MADKSNNKTPQTGSQKHAGRRLSDGHTIWHTNSKGGYWSGWMPDNLSPEELYYACITTISDLMVSHPELLDNLQSQLAKPEKVNNGR